EQRPVPPADFVVREVSDPVRATAIRQDEPARGGNHPLAERGVERIDPVEPRGTPELEGRHERDAEDVRPGRHGARTVDPPPGETLPRRSHPAPDVEIATGPAVLRATVIDRRAAVDAVHAEREEAVAARRDEPCRLPVALDPPPGARRGVKIATRESVPGGEDDGDHDREADAARHAQAVVRTVPTPGYGAHRDSTQKASVRSPPHIGTTVARSGCRCVGTRRSASTLAMTGSFAGCRSRRRTASCRVAAGNLHGATPSRAGVRAAAIPRSAPAPADRR